MKSIFLFLCFFIAISSHGQDLYIQYFDTDQREDSIKGIWITDENGTKMEKNFPAKSQIHLFKIFEKRGYKLIDLEVSTYPQASLNKYHFWFEKINQAEDENSNE